MTDAYAMVSAATGLSASELLALAERSDDAYQSFPRRKSSGGVRWLSAPEPELKVVQRGILDVLLYQLTPHPSAHGFVPGRSILTHAQQHTGQRWVLGLDLYRFFDMTTQAQALGVLSQLTAVTPDEVALLAQLCCRHGVLPQGAPTSPCIANLVFAPADVQIQALAAEHGLSYSRYADDLALSGPELPDRLIDDIAEICGSLGHRLVPRKTRRLGSGTRQVVTGLVVNGKGQGVRAPRDLHRRLRAVLHDASQRGIDAALTLASLTLASLEGSIGWVAQTRPEQAERLWEQLERVLDAEAAAHAAEIQAVASPTTLEPTCP